MIMDIKNFKKTVQESPVRNIIGQGTTIKGDIETIGDFRIDGQLIGSIKVSGRIVVGPTGIVKGSIVCQNADISGNVQAGIKTEELTSMKATSNIEGDLLTSRLAIEVGARFSGKCDMSVVLEKPNETVKG